MKKHPYGEVFASSTVHSMMVEIVWNTAKLLKMGFHLRNSIDLLMLYHDHIALSHLNRKGVTQLVTIIHKPGSAEEWSARSWT